jgi:hypothetical protein
MKITEITVSAGRKFNHPLESYSNLSPSVTLRATLDEGDDPHACTVSLQAQAETVVEEHKRKMLADIEATHQISLQQQEIASLESTIKRAQERLERFKNPDSRPTLPPPYKPDAPTVEIEDDEIPI